MNDEPRAQQVTAGERASWSRQRERSTVVAGVRITSPDRLLYPEVGLTKLGLARYYASVAPRMLPYVVQRPLTLVRCPEGTAAACFFQRHASEGFSEAVLRVPIEEEQGVATYMAITSLAGLISLVQMDVLEVHVWGARLGALETPDRLIFDLDPDPELPFMAVIDAARHVRDQLDALGLRSFVKTTGGKGLHVVAPLAPGEHSQSPSGGADHPGQPAAGRLSSGAYHQNQPAAGPASGGADQPAQPPPEWSSGGGGQLDTPAAGPTWEEVRGLARAIAEAIARASPDRFTASASRSERTGKIYIDYLRNSRGATSVAPFSTRRHAGAPVSMPLRWDELTPRLRANRYTASNARQRLAALRGDPWEGFAEIRQSIAG